jgi:hypothetical protein
MPVAAREAELRLVRQAVVLTAQLPASLEALVVEVLVEVELAEDAVGARPTRRGT